MQVNYHLLNNSVIVSFDGKRFSINNGDERYNAVVSAIKENRLEDIPDLVDNSKRFDKFGVEYRDGMLFLDNERLPDVLENKVLLFMEKELPYEPLLKFVRKMRLNPSFNSRKMLYKFLEHNGHPITQDGNFIAYRGVTKDFKDCHTQTFDNSVGSICEVDRSEVDDNPNNTCSFGLHVAAFEYANGFGSRLIEVEVDPKDVVSVPVDYNGTKMRVCKFKVLSECEQILDDGLYGYEDFELPPLPCEQRHNDDIFSVGDSVFLDSDTTFNGCYFEEGEEIIIRDFSGNGEILGEDVFGNGIVISPDKVRS